MAVSVVTPPAQMPVSVAEAKAWCRADDPADDALLADLIEDATAHAEQYIGRAIMTQTLRMTLDGFTDSIEIARGPLQSVTAVRYYDQDGDLQTVGQEVYTVDTGTTDGWIVRNSDAAWPTPIAGINSVSITYVAGFATVPRPIRRAVLMLVAQWYDHRPAASEKAMADMPFGVASLLGPFRWVLV